MQRKLLASYVAVILIAVGIIAGAVYSKGYEYLTNQSEDYYTMQAQLLGNLFEKENPTNQSEYSQFVKEYADRYCIRITLIGRDGLVYGDSKIDGTLENHATREEVVQALKGNAYSITRYSKTMGMNYCYSAVPVQTDQFDGVLRISIPLSQLKEISADVYRLILVALLVCLVIAVGIAILFTKKISRPIIDVTSAAKKIANGDYTTKIYTNDRAQIGELANAFNSMANHLNVSMKKLTRRNAELEAMLTSMNCGVVAVDDSNAVILYNPLFQNMIKTSYDSLQKRSLYTLVRSSAIIEALEAARGGEDYYCVEGYLDSECEILIRVTATLLTTEEQKNIGILLLIEDITAMKKLETMRSDFVSNVTHELKTPLTSIKGFIDTLKNGAISDPKVAMRFLDIIEIEADRLYSLIQDILLLSEIEAKRDDHGVECDVAGVAEEVVQLLQPRIPESIELIQEIQPDLPLFLCNSDRIKQLLINLLDNAIKYTEKGKITLNIKEEEEQLMIVVSDTGIGMEHEHLSRIFERFYRVDKGRSRKQGGTGLGLSIVKHIVELYHGTVYVDSQIGKGSVFTIRLPYQEN